MKVYDGDSLSATEIASLTGNGLPEVLFSTGSDIFIKFVSDINQARSGFKIRYDVGKKYSIIY